MRSVNESHTDGRITRVARFDVHSRRVRVALALAAVGGYALLFFLAHPLTGGLAAALAILPVAAIGWLLGLRAGLLAGLLSTPLNTLLLNLAGEPGWDVVFRIGGGPGSVTLVLLGAAVGRLSDLRDEVRRELAGRKQAEEELFRALFEHSPDGILLIDPDTFTIIDCNEVACSMNGYRRDELIGQPATMLNAIQVSGDVQAAYVHYLRQEDSLKYEIEHRRKDGTIFPVEVSAAAISVAGRELLLGIDRDITHRKQIEEAEHQQRALAEALRDTAAALNSTLHLDEVLDRILTNVGRVVPHDAVSIMLVEGATAYIARRIGYAEPGLESDVLALRFTVADVSTLRRMAESDQPLVIADTRAYSGWVDRPETRWVRSYIGAPIRLKGRVIGFLNLNSLTPGFFTPAHAGRLQAFADQAATAIENAQLYQVAQRRSEEQAALLVASAAISSSLDLGTVLSRLAEYMGRAIDVSSVYITDWSPEQGISTVLAEYYSPEVTPGENVSDLGVIYDVARDLGEDYAQLLRMGQVVALQVDDPDLPETIRAHLVRYDGRSVLDIPLIVKDTVIGYAVLWESRRRRDFTPQEIALCQGIAQQAAIAFENARLYEALHRHAAELELRVQERTAELESERSRMEAILDAADEGIALIDRSNRVVYINPAMEQLTGYTLAELLGRTARLWSDEHSPPGVGEAVARCLDRGEAWHGEVINRRNDGTLYDAALTLNPLTDADDQVIGFVGVQRDVTRLKELDRLKSQFVSRIGHELRTPLSNLKLYLELLDRGKPEKREQYTQTLYRETARLQKLVEGFLEISQFDADTVSVRSAPTDLNQLVTQLIADRGTLAAERGLTLAVHPDPNLPRALVDPVLIAHAISNVLENALNYTPRGGRVTVATAVRRHADRDWITLTVRDTGLGISPEERPHLFERFFRGEAARDFATPGAGLGLAISKAILDRLGGRIALEEDAVEDQTRPPGAAFTMWLRSAD